MDTTSQAVPDAETPADRLGMTEEQWAWFQAHTRGFGEQDENGVDVSLLRENLKRPVQQRILAGLVLFERGPGYNLEQRERTFRAVLEALARSGARVVLIGGLAMRAHGSAYLTEDIDFCYSRARENLSMVAAALAPFRPSLRGAPEGLPFHWDERTIRHGCNFTLNVAGVGIDLLGDAAGITSFEDLWQRGMDVELYGLKSRVASLDDLIAMKRAANRLKDQSHLLELERLRTLLAERGAGPK